MDEARRREEERRAREQSVWRRKAGANSVKKKPREQAERDRLQKEWEEAHDPPWYPKSNCFLVQPLFASRAESVWKNEYHPLALKRPF